MLQPDTLLQNRYRVVSHLGQGGMGAVYVATDERFGSTVALKETFFRDAALLRAFEREARLLNHLRHTALPKVFDHFAEGDGQFLVMEFIAGDDLSAMLARRAAPFPVPEVLGWADELLDALDYLHTQEPPVVHRDIKPQNLKLTPRGQIVLLDFGLAKGSPSQASQPTASVYGYSRNYAPVEQIQGAGTDTRSDIYSLGATLYHLITGAPPADALTRAMASLDGQADPLRPADEINPQVPRAVAEALAHAMRQTATARTQTAAEMRAELRRAASDAPNVAAAPALAEAPTVAAAAPRIDAAPPASEQPTRVMEQATGPADQETRHSEDATRILIASLEDPSPEVRRASVEALTVLGDPAALEPLKALRWRETSRHVPRWLITQAIEASTPVAQEIDKSRAASLVAAAELAGARGRPSASALSEQRGETTVVAAAPRGSGTRRFAVVAVAAALCAAVAAFAYFFSRAPGAGATSGAQTSQPSPTAAYVPTPHMVFTDPTPSPAPTTERQKQNERAAPQPQVAPQPVAPSQAKHGAGGVRVEGQQNAPAAPTPAAPSPSPEDAPAGAGGPPPPGVQVPPGMEWRRMTPAQRKALMRALRRQMQMQEQMRHPYGEPPLPSPPPRRRRPPV